MVVVALQRVVLCDPAMNNLPEEVCDEKTPVLDKRRAGILLPITSLPEVPFHSDANFSNDNYTTMNNHNGDFSQAFAFIDFLHAAGCSVWQILPLGPTHPDKSPYQCLSAHAGNPLLISVDWLRELKYLPKLTVADDVTFTEQDKKNYLQQAFTIFKKNKSQKNTIQKDYNEFIKMHAVWLQDYALFMAIRQSQGDQHWIEWDSALRDRAEHAMESVRITLSDAIEKIKFEQYIFFQQWQKIKSYAHQKNILLFGDMPLFVAHDSADVWAHRDLFMLDENGQAKIVAGVPPDYFSAEGQRWGNPHYHWQSLQSQHFQWWLERLSTELARIDLLRIDHFRGLAASWAIPATAATAAEGYWLPVPGAELLQALNEKFTQLPLIAEDLGIITPDVKCLRDQFYLPGMKILQFAFDSGTDNPYLPAQHIENCVLYTGTHDNNTSLAWYDALDEHQKNTVDNILKTYINTEAINHKDNMPWPLIYCALASVAKLVILPMQDILSLGEGNRTNTPGTIDNNWQWRFSWSQISPTLVPELKTLLQFYKR